METKNIVFCVAVLRCIQLDNSKTKINGIIRIYFNIIYFN